MGTTVGDEDATDDLVDDADGKTGATDGVEVGAEEIRSVTIVDGGEDAEGLSVGENAGTAQRETDGETLGFIGHVLVVGDRHVAADRGTDTGAPIETMSRACR